MKPNSNSLQIVQYTDNSQIGSDMKSKKLLKNGTSLTFYVRATSSFAVVVVLLFCFVFFSLFFRASWVFVFVSSFDLIFAVLLGCIFLFRFLLPEPLLTRWGDRGRTWQIALLLFFVFFGFSSVPAFQKSRGRNKPHTHTPADKNNVGKGKELSTELFYALPSFLTLSLSLFRVFFLYVPKRWSALLSGSNFRVYLLVASGIT